MRKGQRIRLRNATLAAREWGLPGDAEGEILCLYRVHADRSGDGDRVDVRFNKQTIVWGAPAREFIAVAESA